MAGTAFPNRLSARLPSGGPEVELALIPAGVFSMGDALGRSPERDTRPAHEVFLDAFFGTPQCASNVVSAVLGRPGDRSMPVPWTASVRQVEVRHGGAATIESVEPVSPASGPGGRRPT